MGKIPRDGLSALKRIAFVLKPHHMDFLSGLEHQLPWLPFDKATCMPKCKNLS